MTTPLVSVVIPAWNASSTLRATLRSAMAQGHTTLEIIVVDDGSTDDTFAIAQELAAQDPRIVVLQQPNGGLAAARNAGWRHASADLIAFLDADDVWAPTKIERQLAALLAAGEGVGLVYCGSVRINEVGDVISRFPLPHIEGDVLDRLFAGNFVGNGSASMMTRQALVHANGYEPTLRAAGAQGCEDYLLQCRIAEKFRFAMVPERLVGYRYLPQNMSSDRPRMLRSWMLVVDEMRNRHPDRANALNAGLRSYSTWILYDAAAKGAYSQIPELARLIRRLPLPVVVALPLKDIPSEALKRVRSRVAAFVRRRTGTQHPGDVHFPSVKRVW